MLPGAPVGGKSVSISRRCGRLVRLIIELLLFYNVFASKDTMKRRRRVRNRKLEVFKSLLTWVLVLSLLYIFFFAEPPSPTDRDSSSPTIRRVKSPLSDLNPEYRHRSYINNEIVEDRVSKRPPSPKRKNRRRKEIQKQTEESAINKPGEISDDTLDETIDHLQHKFEEVKKELDFYTNLKVGYSRAKSVKEGFRHAFKGYITHAWGHDEVRPETNETNDSWGGFGVTMIDSLSTMCILGFDDYLQRAEEHIRHINFEKDVVVSFFETTIRHLGGLISGYECSKREVFLTKAKELADRLLPAFDSPSFFPYHQINLKTGEKKNAAWVNEKSILSEVASIQLEWYALSMYTGDFKYYKTSQKALNRVLENTVDDYPGLFYNFLEIKNGEYSTGRNVISIGGAGDSFYEYLLKITLLLPSGNHDDKDINFMEEKSRLLSKYEDAIVGIRRFLVKNWGENPETQQKRSYVGTIGEGADEMEHLVCFFPGLLTLGFLEYPFSKKDDLELAKEILETCINMYTSTETGLAPDRLLFDSRSNTYSVQNGKFILRPETVESLFYMYRATGDRRLQDIGWGIWESIEKHCKTDSAYSGLSDVRTGKKNNSMQSFFLSEVLKYLYLLFHPESENIVDLSQHLFSTEGQVFRRFT